MKLQPGDMGIALSLKGNLGECAEFILEDVHTGRSLSDFKIKLVYYRRNRTSNIKNCYWMDN